MEEEDARRFLNVPRETSVRIEAFIAFLRSENERQNLVSRGSLDQVWNRHILDSAQLTRFAPSPSSSWIDLGTGAGLPGLIVALLHSGPITLVETRKLRVDFLSRASEALELGDRVEIIHSKVEALQPREFDVISARAFAPLHRLLELGERFAAAKTRWVLPKGKNAKSELVAAQALWQGDFRLEQSLTDPDAQIIVAEQVRRRTRGKQRR
jgi:16S rRNA (guanine527-N7)-methyltransferase